MMQLMQPRIYLDYAASTPLDSRVASAMREVEALSGNPSSVHAEGRALRAAIDKARGQIARLLDVPDTQVIFTSGATEANAAAIRGVLRAVRAAHSGVTPRILVSGIEHASVAGSVRAAEEDGDAAVTMIATDERGVVAAEAVAAALTPDTVIVAVQWANNVLGTLQPIAEIGAVVVAERARRGAGGLPIVFLCDAVQAVRTEDVRPSNANIDILTLSAHKLYGPKGVGAMVIAHGTPFAAYAGGGGQESGFRHGTENAAGIAAFGAAAEVLAAERAVDSDAAQSLRMYLTERLRASCKEISFVGAEGVPSIAFLRHRKLHGDEIAMRLDMDSVAVSAGSACDSGSRKAPRVLTYVLDEQSALRGGIRVSFGRGSRAEDIDRLVAALARM